MELTAVESRALGSLVEKQLATPQYYPLTLNALVAACNQSSNREPVSDYAEADVAGALSSLREKGLVRVVHSPSNRAAKYRHVLDEAWGLDGAHRAVLTVLLLRGPQTVGELRARTERLSAFESAGEVEEVLRLLGDREEPLVTRLERQPGQKEARYAHLLAGQPEPPAMVATAAAQRGDGGEGLAAVEARLALAEERLAGLEAVVAELRGLLG